MGDSRPIELIISDDIPHQELLDASDSSWRDTESICSKADNKSLEEPADNWIQACCMLRRAPENYQPPVLDGVFAFNTTTFSHTEGGCTTSQWWAMCLDMDLVHGQLKMTNTSCYDDLTYYNNQYPNHYAYPVYGVIFPVLVTFAIIANVFVMLVLSRKHMQSPTNTVLLYMALADLTVGIVPLPFTFYWFTLKNYTTPWKLISFWCYMHHYLMDALPPICHNVAIWLTVLLAAQRYIYIEFPVRAQSLCTIKNVKRCSIAIVIFSIICGSMRFGDVDFYMYRGFTSAVYPGSPGGPVYVQGGCLAKSKSFVIWYGGLQRYLDTYFWIRAIIFVWLPSLLLICLNVLLIRAIHRAQQRRERLLNESRNREANRQKESNTTSTMLAIIVSIFLVINCPQGLHILLLTLNDKLQLEISFLSEFNSEELMLGLMIDNMLIIATYPLNFAIYCSMSTQFRETFKNLFCSKLPLGSPLSLSRRESSYYGYTPVEGRSCAIRNGYTQESTTSLPLNKTSITSGKVKKSKVGTKDLPSRNTEQTIAGSKRDSVNQNADTSF